MKKPYVKTTVEMDPQLLYMMKTKALQEKKTLKDIFNETVIHYINQPIKKPVKKYLKIGGYHLGGIKGKLRRVEIYDYL